MSRLTGEQLALGAMKKEFNRLSAIAEKSTKKVDEYLGVGTEMLAIHEEFAEIVKSKITNASSLKKLKELQKRSEVTSKIQNQDFMKLSEKQFNDDMNKSNLAQEISRIEFRLEIRS